MKIFFLKKGKEKLGSNRIYIENLSKWISKKNITVLKSNIIKPNFDVYILSKYSKIKDIQYIKKINVGKKVICGLVHPTNLTFSGKEILKCADFVIVGSIEEKDFYKKYNKNVIRFPQLEDIKLQKKNHKFKKTINIGYHGNLEHLEEMSSSTKKALEKINDKYKIKLTVIYDTSLGRWVKGRPNIDIVEVNWSLNNLVKHVSQFDIGIVPCTNNFFLDKPNDKMNLLSYLIKFFTGGKNRRLNDYIIRFKVTSNSGRAFIFHQLDVPVIGDFWPSNFEILGTKDCGILAHSEEGWYSALETLIQSPSLRNQISKNAKKKFLENYNLDDWINKFLYELKKI